MSSETTEYRFQITGMDCANCAKSVETGVQNLPDVNTAALNFTTATLRVNGPVTADRIVARVRELGYDVVDDDDEATAVAPPTSLWTYLWSRWETRLALIGAVLIIPGLIFEELLGGMVFSSPVFDLMSVLALVLAGAPIARSAWRSLRINREITINLLMTIAAVGAVIIGAYAEAGLVMVLFALGEALEGYAAVRARDSLTSLATQVPSQALRLSATSEAWVPVEQLAIGDQIIVKPGDRIPMDGIVVDGLSAVNQAPITGESRLVEKEPGAEVLASSVNGHGTLQIEVTKLSADTTIARLIQMVTEAQERRAPAQRLVDRFAKVYTPAVIVVAILVATIPPLLFGEPFWNPAPDVHGWLYRALALLVVACPCALVISTPVTLISAMSNGARQGVVFKGGAYLETLSRVRSLALDKTGTLTRGRPAVVAVNAADCHAPDTDNCDACDDLLALATAVERRSEHPLAQAVMDEAAGRGLDDRYPAGDQVMAVAGRGVTGMVEGRQVTIGSHTYFDDAVDHVAYCADIAAADALGYTTMLVGDEDGYRGYIAVADTVREGSPEAVAELRSLGIDPLVMLTGDNPATAERIAAEVGIDEVRANCLPADKVAAIETLAAESGPVGMVGDGINDTPAFATASIGVALGRTAQALETADVVLLGDDLRQLPYAIRLARTAMRTVWFNIALSLIIKFAVFVLVLEGTGSMWLAVLADVGTSLLVTANGLRLLRTPKLSL